MKTFSKKLLIIEDLLFVALVFLIPSQLAYHFWPTWAFVGGVRVDYYAPTIYLTDIVIATILIIYFIRKILTKGVNVSMKSLTVVILVSITTLVAANIIYSKLPVLSFIKWLKVIELALLIIYIKVRSEFNKRKLLVTPFVYSAVVFGVIGIFQFCYQKSLGGLFYLLGERSFDVNTIGIAVVNIFGVDKLRMYSTFPHPNALAGYAGVVLMLLLVWKKMIKKANDKTLYWLSFLTLCVVLLYTFSKLAWISLVLVGFVYLVSKMNIQLFKILAKILFLFIISISLFFTTFPLSTVSNRQYGTVTERIALAKVAGKAFSDNVLTGVGVNGYIVQLSKYDLPTNIRWLLQPVHNIYLLILSELGLILFIAVVIGLYKTLTVVLENKSMLVFPFFFILLTGMFDHYWLTIQQNQLIATILFAVIIREHYEYKGKRVRSSKNLL